MVSHKTCSINLASIRTFPTEVLTEFCMLKFHLLFVSRFIAQSMGFLKRFFVINLSFSLIFWRSTATALKKRRLCVDVEVENYRSNAPVLGIYSMLIKQMCFLRCMRDASCEAFHFRYQGGVCDLLPKPDSCLGQNITNGTLYVELNTCGLYPPRKAFLPPSDTWRWVSDVTDLTDTVALVSSGTRYVSRVFERGVYLPGWWLGDQYGFRALRPYNEVTSCGSDDKPGELLIFHDGRYLWSPFTAGNPVPINAVMGGYWMDLSPLYIVKITVSGFMCAGYYSISLGQAFVECLGNHNPSSMDILLYN